MSVSKLFTSVARNWLLEQVTLLQAGPIATRIAGVFRAV